LERLQEGPVIGDGGFVFALEKRGYLKAGPWTPEVTVEHPDAGEFSFVLVVPDISRYFILLIRIVYFRFNRLLLPTET